MAGHTDAPDWPAFLEFARTFISPKGKTLPVIESASQVLTFWPPSHDNAKVTLDKAMYDAKTLYLVWRCGRTAFEFEERYAACQAERLIN